MSGIDEAIARGKRRRKVIAVGAVIGIILVALIYFGWLFLTKGYSFNIQPEDAAHAPSFTVSQGNGFFIGSKLYVIGSSASAIVSAPKYAPETITINDTSPSTIEVTLTPLPATVTISTQPQLDGVKWSVNGQQVAQSSSLNTQLPAGHYSVVASHPSYESGSLSFDAPIAGEIQETIALSPIQGTLVINSKPSGATVTINGDSVGQTPLQLKRQGGKYDVKIAYEGYQTISDTIEITKLRPEPTRNYNMKPLQAKLTVNASPSAGVILLDGKPVKSPISLDANTTHTIRYEKTGYIGQQKSVYLKPAQNDTITFSLTPEIGKVEFTATETAQVFIDGVLKGQTPLTLELQALPQAVSFQREGYRTVEKKVTPTNKSTVRVNAEMYREFDARRKEGKPLFVTSLGIQMTKVSPRKFTMGSPPNEKGRQRNEHQVTVDFSRDVWISRHEITEAQYYASTGKTGGSKLPVTNVSWLDAAKYTNWLSQQEGLIPFYVIKNNRLVGINKNARGYRLVTEAEWEFIAKLNRRSSPTTFIWGSTERIRDNQGNFADASLRGQQTFILSDYNDGFAGKAPVGSFKAERGGFYDLDGNVREWVHDFYTVTPPDTSITHRDYLGVSNGVSHVVKGASFKTGRVKNIRASVRTGESTPADDIGFRIARYNN